MLLLLRVFDCVPFYMAFLSIAPPPSRARREKSPFHVRVGNRLFVCCCRLRTVCVSAVMGRKYESILGSILEDMVELSELKIRFCGVRLAPQEPNCTRMLGTECLESLDSFSSSGLYKGPKDYLLQN